MLKHNAGFRKRDFSVQRSDQKLEKGALDKYFNTGPPTFIGGSHFHASTAIRFMHCVAKEFTPKDYAAICLSGIVQISEQAAMKTK